MDSIMPTGLGNSTVDQVIQVVIVMLFMYVLLSILNNAGILYGTWQEMNTVLQPDTSSATDTFTQEPNLDTSKTCFLSRNEAGGTEFTYSVFLNFRNSNFTKEQNTLHHVFHKGSPPPDAYPLLAPGVFTVSDSNTLRIVMNSADKWDNYVDIPNIPVEKWFHLVIACKGRALDVFINGNVIQRMTLTSVPKLNFGDVYAFQAIQNDDTRVGSAPESRYSVNGKADGMLSRLNYYAYALSYAEIDALYRQGPSSKIVSASDQIPPYMADAWWVQSYQGNF
jgi:hypothetical protein